MLLIKEYVCAVVIHPGYEEQFFLDILINILSSYLRIQMVNNQHFLRLQLNISSWYNLVMVVYLYMHKFFLRCTQLCILWTLY
jgi:hypothetical protein